MAELRDTGEFIGYVGPAVASFEAPFTPCVELGCALLPDYWRQGLATEAVHAVLGYGFEKLGLNEMVGFTVLANMRSRRLMEKIGMVHDPAGDFEHPLLPQGHPMRKHVLYRAKRIM